VISYLATLDVPRELVRFVAGLLRQERRARGTRRGRRALTCWWQAVLVLRWLRDGASMRRLAADHRISASTTYRYLHEGLDALAAAAPELTEVIGDCLQRAVGHVILDGTLVPTDRVAARTETGNDLWYSGKHHTHGGNVQILSDPAGNPLWTSEVRPGSVHDLTCARELALPALYPHAHDLPTLADKGYIGAGIGIHTPIRRPAGGAQLCPDTRTYNTLINATRALGERAIAQLKTRWRALHHVTLDPNRIGDITRAALVLHRLENTHSY
jgi:hypothetical protein